MKRNNEPLWYVIRMPGGVGGGGAARHLPIPIKRLSLIVSMANKIEPVLAQFK